MYTCNYCGEDTALNYDACRGCAHYPCFCGQNVPVLVMCADCRDKTPSPSFS